MRLVIILAVCTILATGCAEKKAAPFCLNCEEGVLIQEGPDHWFSHFISDSGDTLDIQTNISESMEGDEGIKVCARLKKAKLHQAINCHAVYQMQCVDRR